MTWTRDGQCLVRGTFTYLYTNTETRTVKLTGTKRETLIPHRSNTPIRIVTATRTGIRRRILTGKRTWTMALTRTRKVSGAKIVS